MPENNINSLYWKRWELVMLKCGVKTFHDAEGQPHYDLSNVDMVKFKRDGLRLYREVKQLPGYMSE